MVGVLALKLCSDGGLIARARSPAGGRESAPFVADGVVTSLKEEHEKSASRIFSNAAILLEGKQGRLIQPCRFPSLKLLPPQLHRVSFIAPALAPEIALKAFRTH